MADELVFHVDQGTATSAIPITLAAAGLREREHLQEWVIAHPEILGEHVMILTSEYDGWETFDGKRTANRLDVLGVSNEGQLVVAELKRDRAGDNVQLQAINYAALVARMTPDDVVRVYQEHRRSRDEELDSEAARKRIEDHCGELDVELLGSPRIVLVASEYSGVTLTAVDWLSTGERGLDITLQRVQAYRLQTGDLVVTSSQLYPPPAIEERLVGPRKEKEKAKLAAVSGKREKNAVHRILQDDLLESGTPLTLITTNEVSSDIRSRVAQWIAEDPRRGNATWQLSRSAPLLWEADGKGYKPTTLVKLIIKESTGIDQATVWGTKWWETDDHETLTDIAGSPAGQTGFDWDPLHDLLSKIPAGKWASYGDIATVIGTAAQPLGAHFLRCDVCENGWRVLDRNGESRGGFVWTRENRTDTQQQALEVEGVHFNAQGRADAEVRLSAEDLTELARDD
ncbi:MAG: MGMT family protein [Leucobacter sp.]|nr:MGMT family protein [Leucobacter sp.]